jgi:hypothetical protein
MKLEFSPGEPKAFSSEERAKSYNEAFKEETTSVDTAIVGSGMRSGKRRLNLLHSEKRLARSSARIAAHLHRRPPSTLKQRPEKHLTLRRTQPHICPGRWKL